MLLLLLRRLIDGSQVNHGSIGQKVKVYQSGQTPIQIERRQLRVVTVIS
jgi:hypothetical protein